MQSRKEYFEMCEEFAFNQGHRIIKKEGRQQRRQEGRKGRKK